ncbi:MAG: hypothetical protein ACRYGR_03425 [Janthinobacterium lividum]
MGYIIENENDSEVLKSIIQVLQADLVEDRGQAPVHNAFEKEKTYLDDPESSQVQRLVAQEMNNMQKEYDNQLVIIKDTNPQRFNAQLTTAFINFQETTHYEHINQVPGGLNHYNNVLIPQYKAEQTAIKNYAKTLGFKPPEDNLTYLYNSIKAKHNISQEVARKAYNIIMAIDD